MEIKKSLNENDISDVKRALKIFDDMEGGLMLFLERKHEGIEKLDLESIFQTILDTHMEIRILKNIIIKCLGIENLDSPREKYGDRFYIDKMTR